MSNLCNLPFIDKFTDEQLAHEWTLSEEDFIFIQRYRKPFRSWLAVQLCAMRFYHRFLEHCTDLSPRNASYITNQLALDPTLSITVPAREATLSNANGFKLSWF